MKTIYVVTIPENGWDCIHTVYLADSEEKVIECIINEEDVTKEWIENNYVITEKNLIEI